MMCCIWYWFDLICLKQAPVKAANMWHQTNKKREEKRKTDKQMNKQNIYKYKVAVWGGAKRGARLMISSPPCIVV